MDPLFPDNLHFFLFSFYICLFVNQGILVTASKESDGSYKYNTTTVVLLTETVKLILAVGLYLREKSFQQLISDAKASGKVFTLYLIPSFLYCLYNNLAFVNLKHYDPTSYFLLLNFRTVATGVIFQVSAAGFLGTSWFLVWGPTLRFSRQHVSLLFSFLQLGR